MVAYRLGADPKRFATRALSRPPKVPAAYILRTGLGQPWVCSAHRYVPSVTTGIFTVSSNSVPWKKSNCSRRIEAAGEPAAPSSSPCATPFPASRRPWLSAQTSRRRWQPRTNKPPGAGVGGILRDHRRVGKPRLAGQPNEVVIVVEVPSRSCAVEQLHPRPGAGGLPVAVGLLQDGTQRRQAGTTGDHEKIR